MKFGFFDDLRKEYVITTPQTPYPWINYLGNRDFLGLISNIGGGYCFYKDARLRRVTRYRYNNVPLDLGGRYFYLKDGQTVWSPTWRPAETPLDDYQCRHGLGYTKIIGRKNDIETELLFFVPLEENCEIHRLRISNQSSSERQLTLFSMIEFCLWNAYDDQTNFQRNLSIGEVEVAGNVIYHKTEYRERRNHYAFYGVNHPIVGFDTDRECFIGSYNGFNHPQVVFQGKPGNSIADGWAPIASHCLNLTLGPGETRELVFVLGYAENRVNDKWAADGSLNKTVARKVMEKYATAKAVENAFQGLSAYWNDLLSVFMVESPDEKLNRMVNVWNPYQSMVTFNLSRSASFFESGIGRGIGFRDSNQDIAGFVGMVPDRARQRILDLAATQMADGSAFHQYQPLTKQGNSDIGSGFNDDPLWMIYSVISYIKEIGDLDILNAAAPFSDDGNESITLMDHLRSSVNHVINHLGPHGLPLIGRADWNDCLNLNCYSETPDESFQTCTSKDGKTAESILIAAMFILYATEYAELCRKINRTAEAQVTLEAVENMKSAVVRHGFDGEWFLRAYDDQGRTVGSAENEEGKIFIETQGFCVMAGVGLENGMALKALESVAKYLDSEHGICLVNPAYTKYYPELGEITTYPPGYKENAGIFCHNNPWVMIAETKLKRADRAFDYYKKIAPAYREDISDVHRMEPYVYSQMIAGKDAKRHGEAKNSWLTGTAAWNYVAISQYIIGVRPDYDGLIIDPCLPKEIDHLTIQRKFRGALYRIRIDNRNTGGYCLKMGDQQLADKKVPVVPAGSVIEVYCQI